MRGGEKEMRGDAKDMRGDANKMLACCDDSVLFAKKKPSSSVHFQLMLCYAQKQEAAQ
jgi:hypothetical protein